jgi:nicotinate-nucleotide pyrophosphorylase (carboxylating)
LVKEGQALDGKTEKKMVATVEGPAYRILQGERTALNILARASGIATRARRLVNMKHQHGWKGLIAGTRKTTPGFRSVEKYAMLVGGIDSHRHDLSSMVMLKDNHIWASGSITQCIEKAKAAAGFSLKIEVECRSLDEAREAIHAGADIIMLDNFDGPKAGEASAILKSEFQKSHPHVLLECSGGLTEENMAHYLYPSIDILSFGSASQSVPHIDFSLKINQ